MIEFIRRHWLSFAIAVFGLVVAYGLSWLWQDHQVGIGPDFIIKAFGKLFYVGLILIISHIIIKYWYPTIYWYTYTAGDTKESKFREMWDKSAFFDQRIMVSVLVHLGVMFIVSLIMALAF